MGLLVIDNSFMWPAQTVNANRSQNLTHIISKQSHSHTHLPLTLYCQTPPCLGSS